MNSNTGTSSTKGKRKADATMPRDNQGKCVEIDPILPSAKRIQTSRKKPTTSDRDELQSQSVSPMRSRLRPRPCVSTSPPPKRKGKRKRTASTNKQVEQNVTVEPKLERALCVIEDLVSRVKNAEEQNAELATRLNKSEQQQAELQQKYTTFYEEFQTAYEKIRGRVYQYVENVMESNSKEIYEQTKRITYIVRKLNGIFVWALPVGRRQQEGVAVNIEFEMPSATRDYTHTVFNDHNTVTEIWD
jgi:Skp family chaperone for outer membrane proteins